MSANLRWQLERDGPTRLVPRRRRRRRGDADLDTTSVTLAQLAPFFFNELVQLRSLFETVMANSVPKSSGPCKGKVAPPEHNPNAIYGQMERACVAARQFWLDVLDILDKAPNSNEPGGVTSPIDLSKMLRLSTLLNDPLNDRMRKSSFTISLTPRADRPLLPIVTLENEVSKVALAFSELHTMKAIPPWLSESFDKAREEGTRCLQTCCARLLNSVSIRRQSSTPAPSEAQWPSPPQPNWKIVAQSSSAPRDLHGRSRSPPLEVPPIASSHSSRRSSLARSDAHDLSHLPLFLGNHSKYIQRTRISQGRGASFVTNRKAPTPSPSVQSHGRQERNPASAATTAAAAFMEQAITLLSTWRRLPSSPMTVSPRTSALNTHASAGEDAVLPLHIYRHRHS